MLVPYNIIMNLNNVMQIYMMAFKWTKGQPLYLVYKLEDKPQFKELEVKNEPERKLLQI